jgi:hypothetical protein
MYLWSLRILLNLLLLCRRLLIMSYKLPRTRWSFITWSTCWSKSNIHLLLLLIHYSLYVLGCYNLTTFSLSKLLKTVLLLLQMLFNIWCLVYLLWLLVYANSIKSILILDLINLILTIHVIAHIIKLLKHLLLLSFTKTESKLWCAWVGSKYFNRSISEWWQNWLWSYLLLYLILLLI